MSTQKRKSRCPKGWRKSEYVEGGFERETVADYLFTIKVDDANSRYWLLINRSGSKGECLYHTLKMAVLEANKLTKTWFYGRWR